MPDNPYETPQTDLRQLNTSQHTNRFLDWGGAILLVQLLGLFLPFGLMLIGVGFITPKIAWIAAAASNFLCLVAIWWGVHNKRYVYAIGEFAFLLTIASPVLGFFVMGAMK